MDNPTQNARGDYREAWKHLPWDEMANIYSTKDHVVFLDKDGQLDWQTSVEYDEGAPNNPRFDIAAYNSILNAAALLEATPIERFQTEARKQSRRLIDEAICCAFDFDDAGARSMPQAAERYLRARGEDSLWNYRDRSHVFGRVANGMNCD